MTEQGHLLVAERVRVRLGWPDETRSGLYLGAIAPDAHRIAVHLNYRDLHFRSQRRVGYRLADFLRNHLQPALAEDDLQARSFFTGWLTHICADDVWRQRIRHDLPGLWQLMAEAGRLERMTLRQEFHDEAAWVDQQMYHQDAGGIEDIRWHLEQATAQFTIPPLKTGEINAWRQNVVLESLPPAYYGQQEPKYLTVQFVLDSLEQAEEEAVAMIEWEYSKMQAS